LALFDVEGVLRPFGYAIEDFRVSKEDCSEIREVSSLDSSAVEESATNFAFVTDYDFVRPGILDII